MNKTAEQPPYHREHLREDLLNEARRILTESGVDKVTLRELARATNVSHAAPLRHFKNRQAVLDALAQMGFEELGQLLKEATVTKTAALPQKLTTAALAFCSFATKNIALFDLMNSSKHLEEGEQLTTASVKAFAPIVDLIKNGQQQSLIQSGPPEEIGLTLYATLFGLATLVNIRLLPITNLNQAVAQAVTIFLQGVKPI